MYIGEKKELKIIGNTMAQSSTEVKEDMEQVRITHIMFLSTFATCYLVTSTQVQSEIFYLD